MTVFLTFFFFAGTLTGTGRWKVSAKIQQLLNTLKRPKRRPLPEFYEDDDIELEIAANPKDPNAPKPEGSTMTPALGEQLVVSHPNTRIFISWKRLIRFCETVKFIEVVFTLTGVEKNPFLKRPVITSRCKFGGNLV